MSAEVHGPLAEAEAAIDRVPDVLAVRSVIDERGCEIHVLAAPGRSVDEIAADVRSIVAVHARELTLRKVHVVAAAPDEPPAPADATAPAPSASVDAERVELVDVVVLFEGRSARIMSTLGRGTTTVTGSATTIAAGASTRRAVAEATLGALIELTGRPRDLAVETVLLVQLPTQQLAVVVLEVLVPQGGETNLAGSALVRTNGVYDAVGRAVLDATNRPLSRPPDV